MKDYDVMNRSVEINNQPLKLPVTANAQRDDLDCYLNKSYDAAHEQTGNISMKLNSLYNSKVYNNTNKSKNNNIL